jgi:hypothetical protein
MAQWLPAEGAGAALIYRISARPIGSLAMEDYTLSRAPERVAGAGRLDYAAL